MDETWVHHLTPVAKVYTWSPWKKTNTVTSAGEGMTSASSDADHNLVVGYLQKGQTINDTYYSSLMMQLRKIIKFKKLGKAQ